MGLIFRVDKKKMKKGIKKKIDKKNLNMHVSHNPITGETYVDKFNIDFIRYFKFQNMCMAFIGSIIGFMFWVLYPGLFYWTSNIDINFFYLIAITFGILWFIFTSVIAFFAIGSFHESVRLASRRGLFTFNVMVIVALVGLTLTGLVYWDLKFYYFLKFLMIGMLIEAPFALSLDYGISFMQGSFFKK